MKKLYIPFENFTSVGGPGSFMANLKEFLERRRCKLAPSLNHANTIFFPITHPLDELDRLKSRGGRVIQRLDGVYYPSCHGETYLGFNATVKRIYHDFTDHAVFQSDYSRRQCFEMLGEKTVDDYTLIINGANERLFYPENASLQMPERINLVTTGVFRRPLMLVPLIEALDRLQPNYSFGLDIVGPIVDPQLEPLIERSYVKHLGTKSLEETAAVVRRAHIFLFSQNNPPCPNSVVEANASAVPVVGFNSGAMSELCFFNSDLLAYVSDDLFQKADDFSSDKLAAKIELCIQQYATYKKNSLDNAGSFGFNACGSKYLKVVEKALASYRWSLNSTAKRIFFPVLEKTTRLFLTRTSNFRLAKIVVDQLKDRQKNQAPQKTLSLLFDLDNQMYQLEGRSSCAYGNGVHTKHRHTKYHDFFSENIKPGSQVLDIGCGTGAVAADIADKIDGASIYAMDLNRHNIETAKGVNARNNITYVAGDALKDLPGQKFDVIVLSAVLEHLERRVEFLAELNAKYRPRSILIRVPAFERDWRVPLKKELGLEYRMDQTHYIEYTLEDFKREIDEAGLNILDSRMAWGEIWAVAIPRN